MQMKTLFFSFLCRFSFIFKMFHFVLNLELYELAGDLTYKLHRPEAAIVMYRKGGAYARAIELARNVAPEDVTNLEEEWGDWYVLYLCLWEIEFSRPFT